MSVYKEMLHELQTLAKRQRRIFNDACDEGLPYSAANVEAIRKVMNHWICPLKDFELRFDERGNKQSHTYERETTFFIPIENDGGQVSGIRVELLYAQIRKGNMVENVISPNDFESPSFFYINVSQDVMHDDFLPNYLREMV